MQLAEVIDYVPNARIIHIDLTHHQHIDSTHRSAHPLNPLKIENLKNYKQTSNYDRHQKSTHMHIHMTNMKIMIPSYCRSTPKLVINIITKDSSSVFLFVLPDPFAETPESACRRCF